MTQGKDIVIIGGGIIGLAIAVELSLRGASVTLLSRDFAQGATHAAAGMLAPRAEQLPDGAMLALALKSLYQYPQWTAKIEELTGDDVDYNPCGILAPTYQLPRSNFRGSSPRSTWLDRQALQFYQSGFGADVVGGWWYPEEGQVDPSKLAHSLRKAAQHLSIDLREGVEAIAFSQQGGKVKNLLTKGGIFEAGTYILAGGAWSCKLLPIPVRPVKGQMLSLKMPQQEGGIYPLERVIYGENTYLVPKQNGRLIVGATVEDVGWVPHPTARGINTLLQRTIRLFPEAADWQLDKIWYGYRPGTPDELPIIGSGHCDNLMVAAGHYRNGILLAPATASLIADLVVEGRSDPLLAHFSLNRFGPREPEKSTISRTIMTEPKSSQGFPPQSLNGIVSASHRAESARTSSTNFPATYPTPAQKGKVNGRQPSSPNNDLEGDPLIIAGRKFNSRLMTGTGKYPDLETMQQSILASHCEIVTVAVRRVQTLAPGHEGLAEAIDWNQIWMLPNTAGCKSAEEAIRVARLGREMAKLLGQEDNNFVKLEVIPDSKYLLPDPLGTLQAAEQLVKEGFAVLPYINADPLLARRLEEVGCATVMPLGSPIGSGQGIRNEANIQIIIEQAGIPVVIDAGIGSPSEATLGMELGADALLINSAIALAQNPVQMAEAMGLAARAGRLAYLAGRIPIKSHASASSPLTGVVSS